MIFIMILMIILFVVGKSSIEASQTPTETKKQCPPHKWVYGEDGFLICSECHLTPGYSGRDQ